MTNSYICASRKASVRLLQVNVPCCHADTRKSFALVRKQQNKPCWVAPTQDSHSILQATIQASLKRQCIHAVIAMLAGTLSACCACLPACLPACALACNRTMTYAVNCILRIALPIDFLHIGLRLKHISYSYCQLPMAYCVLTTVSSAYRLSANCLPYVWRRNFLCLYSASV